MSVSDRLKFAAPAKVNLRLKVVGKRHDGYHELQTWMQKIALYDWITLELKREPGVELVSSSRQVPANSDNLAWKAAFHFFKHIGKAEKIGVKIRLEKNIPVAAGLGGGSSDAGTVLKGLNGMLNNPCSTEDLLDMALGLGADVPFFATDHDAVWAEGVGEVMTPVPSLSDVSFVIVNPGISVSTKSVFENFVLTEENEKSKLCCSSGIDGFTLEPDMFENDLEAVTEARYPVVKEVKSSLLEAGAKYVLMSGSGPTVFGIFPDSDKNSCIQVEDAVKTMRLRFGKKTYKARTSAGA